MAGKPQLDRPFWWPSPRGWIAIASFALAAFMISVSAWRPDLMKEQLWAQLATATVINAWAQVLGFWFASSSGSETKQASIDKALDVMKEPKA